MGWPWPAALGLDRLTKEKFAQFCLDHRDLRIERNGSGQIMIMPLVFTESSFPNNELFRQPRSIYRQV